jgi:RimJ/RimL family protein N-acetyltransferase
MSSMTGSRMDTESTGPSLGCGRLGSPARSGRWTELRPLNREDISFVYSLAIDENTGFRWRYAGAVPPFDVFSQNLWNGISAQFIVRERIKNQPIGLVQLYNVDHIQQFGYLAAAFVESVQGAGIAMEGIISFTSYVFTTWCIRKLYLDMPEYNVPQVASMAKNGPAKLEGRFRQHSFYRGRWWDRLMFAVFREEFEEWREQLQFTKKEA